jgi:hypothetical protein
MIDGDAEEAEAESENALYGLIIARTLRQLAARVRASGCRTIEEFARRESLN